MQESITETLRNLTETRPNLQFIPGGGEPLGFQQKSKFIKDSFQRFEKIQRTHKQDSYPLHDWTTSQLQNRAGMMVTKILDPSKKISKESKEIHSRNLFTDMFLSFHQMNKFYRNTSSNSIIDNKKC